ncbi:MAG: HI0074 family nucleotidyltransferase substrate-binding subunit [Rhodoferax sp.]|nr:HI0074 family nucleotidyltransferase substrate-binding subunit [Rhodoferax sp.]MCB2029289.1 HI0074 family nucleotidyltransferase substrate-binding subunit [Rhodoferax sp.]MCB2040318.1 HI0074 family nucleotidyltransferase substrate-binding subunit [Rhodoferax sp.]MCP5262248.1 nucleotidyltransferase substrate binding protein [Rhodoferax sp.]
MSDDRFDQRLSQFRDAVVALKLALAQPEDEFMRDSIIKRFELSFETARKAMRQWLVDQQEVTYESTKKAVMDAAFKTALVTDPDLWTEMTAARNDATHEYDKAKAIEIVALIRARAVAGFDALLAKLEGR